MAATKIALGLLLGWATLAGAATQTGDTGTLNSAAITGPGATTDICQVDGRVNLLMYITGTAGTSTCVCQQSGDGTNWTALTGTAITNALGVECNVNFPTGFYRVNCSACSAGCSVTVKYKAVRLK